MCVKCLNDWCEDVEDCPNSPYDPMEDKMCNKCHNDCSCNKRSEPTKFEVGKKYKLRSSNKIVYTCNFVGKSGKAFMSYVDECGKEDDSWATNAVFWVEYVEPPKLYFKDLKPGDKFKWVRRRGCGKNAVCVKYDTTVGNGNGAISPSSIGLWAYLGEHTLGCANLSTDSPEREKELTEVIHVE